MTLALAVGGVALTTPTVADAFCGFYVSGADAELFNNATMVVMAESAASASTSTSTSTPSSQLASSIRCEARTS